MDSLGEDGCPTLKDSSRDLIVSAKWWSHLWCCKPVPLWLRPPSMPIAWLKQYRMVVDLPKYSDGELLKTTLRAMLFADNAA